MAGIQYGEAISGSVSLGAGATNLSIEADDKLLQTGNSCGSW